MIEEPYNMTRGEVQLATHKHNGSLRCYLPLTTISMQKNLRHQLTPSRDTDDQ